MELDKKNLILIIIGLIIIILSIIGTLGLIFIIVGIMIALLSLTRKLILVGILLLILIAVILVIFLVPQVSNYFTF
jgi:hypothetical protein